VFARQAVGRDAAEYEGVVVGWAGEFLASHPSDKCGRLDGAPEIYAGPVLIHRGSMSPMSPKEGDMGHPRYSSVGVRWNGFRYPHISESRCGAHSLIVIVPGPQMRETGGTESD
jgi:hypothetical protein